MLVKDVALAARMVKAGPDEGLAEGEFTAYASVFGNKDSYGDVIVRGAFAEDLKRWEDSGNPIPALFGHNMSDPDFNIGHVVEAKEDDHGLLVKVQLDLENPKAAQVYRMVKGRRINQMSFAYDVLEGESVTKDDEHHYELRKLRLYEVSVVTIGANQETEILAVKSAADALVAKAGRVLSAKNEQTLRAAHESLVGAASEIKNVLVAVEGDESKSASEASDGLSVKPEEPSQAKGEEPTDASPVALLAAQANIYALTVSAEGGSS